MTGMTGYGFAESENEKMNCSVEIKSYNSRYLEFGFNLPPFLTPLEPQLKSLISEKAKRGKIEVTLRLRELEEQIEIHIDEKTLMAYVDTLSRCAKIAGIDKPLSLEMIVSLDGVLKTVKNRNIELLWQSVIPVFDKAFAEFTDSRKREGEEARLDITKQLAKIESSTQSIDAYAAEMEERITGDIRERFLQVFGTNAPDEQRILSETAVLLVKYTISEELNRLGCHIKAFREMLDSDEPAGKKCDFLCQEMNREINTIGSKSMITEVSQHVIAMKDSLENIREQLRNVE